MATLAINIHERAVAGVALPGPESEKLCGGAAAIAARFRWRNRGPGSPAASSSYGGKGGRKRGLAGWRSPAGSVRRQEEPLRPP